ncbi:uncharacterized protein L969DRAFT_96338 [Mixia osmundae IAM 14324]|uniref:Uncharacterized protein n=1 Tax=Mixia osmundae (strain CBS 9802 / IAM 14324 / JCM 22182 / KY 12970) TaxID=764103 RepID=G7DV08_MIXOS|nr:uncharacterized protein L969DRAFT_96338 [Mixia osmundae IAM 14324]KEI37249.1 hypothetical protein L969DRAFT_96338 [Mixia osmundae IAM 14324]GAA94418.1 hypothetical protein E5Q_01070 [Mixia osmundae IAM 14324]
MGNAAILRMQYWAPLRLRRHYTDRETDENRAASAAREPKDTRHIFYRPCLGLIAGQYITTERWACSIPPGVDIITVSKGFGTGVWLTGQFTAFCLSERARELHLQYPPLASIDTLDNLPDWAADEAGFIRWYLQEDKRWNWLNDPNTFRIDPRTLRTLDVRLSYARGEALSMPQDVSRTNAANRITDRARWLTPYHLTARGYYEALNVTAADPFSACHGDWFNPVGICPELHTLFAERLRDADQWHLSLPDRASFCPSRYRLRRSLLLQHHATRLRMQQTFTMQSCSIQQDWYGIYSLHDQTSPHSGWL